MKTKCVQRLKPTKKTVLHLKKEGANQTINEAKPSFKSTKMPAVPGSMYASNQQPSCFSKMKHGFTIGFCVGMASGALFGGFGALRLDYAE